MKRIIVEIDGIRHQIIADTKGQDHCTKDGCSLYGFCQKAPVATCNIVATNGYHFEKETHSPQENESVRM